VKLSEAFDKDPETIGLGMISNLSTILLFSISSFMGLKFTDMPITSGKCSSVLSFRSRQEDAARIVPIVHNPRGTTLESRPKSL
jgi:hypothetical protein